VVSGTALPRTEPGLRAWLFALWLVILAVAAVSLVLAPVEELVTIEVVIFSFAALYGFGVWPVVQAASSVLAFGAFAGVVMVPRAWRGELPPVELVEVVASVALAGIVMFHVRRRVQAVDRANRLAEADRRRAAARDRLSRMTSHELRTPLTIATGYVEQLLVDEREDQRREDLLTVRDELVQLARVTDRLVRAVALDLGAPEETTDVTALLEEVRRRWSGVVDRDFVVDSTVRTVPVNGERLRAALDTLVENSVRYTVDGDRICLFSASVDGHAEVGVADSGPGLSDELILRIVAEDEGPQDEVDTSIGADAAAQRLRDLYSRTGFGLRLVAGIAQTAGGRVVASRSPYGGACVALAIPLARSERHDVLRVQGPQHGVGATARAGTA
jgi:two-component system, OmpR family, sensor kinase